MRIRDYFFSGLITAGAAFLVIVSGLFLILTCISWLGGN